MQDQRSANDISWSEFESEEAYRDRLRRQTEENSSAPVSWEDQQERLLRQKYIELRLVSSVEMSLLSFICDIVLASETEVAILHGTLGLDNAFVLLYHFLFRGHTRRDQCPFSFAPFSLAPYRLASILDNCKYLSKT